MVPSTAFPFISVIKAESVSATYDDANVEPVQITSDNFIRPGHSVEVGSTCVTASVALTSVTNVNSTANLNERVPNQIQEGSSYFLDNLEIQALTKTIVPTRLPDKYRPNCFKCQAKFSVTSFPIVKRHHCRCCGDIFCVNCSNHKMVLKLPGIEYGSDVRCCDYCIRHLSTGDYNCMSKYIGILRIPDSSEGLKLEAMKALLLSIEHETISVSNVLLNSAAVCEQEQQLQFYSTSLSNHTADSDMNIQFYPALFDLISQHGLESIWTYISSNLVNRSYSESFKLVGLQVILNILHRVSSQEAVKTLTQNNLFTVLTSIVWNKFESLVVLTELIEKCTNIDANTMLSCYLSDNKLLLQTMSILKFCSMNIWNQEYKLLISSTVSSILKVLISLSTANGDLIFDRLNYTRQFITKCLDVESKNISEILLSLLSLDIVELKTLIFELFDIVLRVTSHYSETKAWYSVCVNILKNSDICMIINQFIVNLLSHQLSNTDSQSKNKSYKEEMINEFIFLKKPVLTITTDVMHNLKNILSLAQVLSCETSLHEKMLLETLFNVESANSGYKNGHLEAARNSRAYLRVDDSETHSYSYDIPDYELESDSFRPSTESNVVPLHHFRDISSNTTTGHLSQNSPVSSVVISESMLSLCDRILFAIVHQLLPSEINVIMSLGEKNNDLEHSIMSSIFKILYNLCSEVQGTRGSMMREFSFIDSAIRSISSSSNMVATIASPELILSSLFSPLHSSGMDPMENSSISRSINSSSLMLNMVGDAIKLIFLFVYHPLFAGSLMLAKSQNILSATIVNYLLCLFKITSEITASSSTQSKFFVQALSYSLRSPLQLQIMVVTVFETLSFVLYQVYVNDSLTSSNITNTMEVEVDWSTKEIFLSIMNNDEIWSCLLQMISSKSKAFYAARFVYVLSSYREVEVLESFHEHIQAWNITESLLELKNSILSSSELAQIDSLGGYGARGEENVSPDISTTVVADNLARISSNHSSQSNLSSASSLPAQNQQKSGQNLLNDYNIESIIFCLGSLCGAPAYYPWETSLLCQRLANNNEVPGQEKSIMLLSQHRVNFEYNEIFYCTSNAHKISERQLKTYMSSLDGQNSKDLLSKISRVLLIEHTVRLECQRSINALIFPYISDVNHSHANLTISVAALRLLQILLHDPVEAVRIVDKYHSDIIGFISFLDNLDPVTKIIAFDVFGIVISLSNRHFSPPMIDNTITDLTKVSYRKNFLNEMILSSIEHIVNHNSLCLIKNKDCHAVNGNHWIEHCYLNCKVLSTLLLFTSNISYHDFILNNGFDVLSKILLLIDGHLLNETIDSSHLVLTSMFILYRIISMMNRSNSQITYTPMNNLSRNVENELLLIKILQNKRDVLSTLNRLMLYGDDILKNQSLLPAFSYPTSIDYKILSSSIVYYSSGSDASAFSVLSSSSFSMNNLPSILIGDSGNRIQGMALMIILTLARHQSSEFTNQASELTSSQIFCSSKNAFSQILLDDKYSIVSTVLQVMCNIYNHSCDETKYIRGTQSGSNNNNLILVNDVPYELLTWQDIRLQTSGSGNSLFALTLSSTCSNKCMHISIEILYVLSQFDEGCIYIHQLLNSTYQLVLALLINIWANSVNPAMTFMALIILKRCGFKYSSHSLQVYI